MSEAILELNEIKNRVSAEEWAVRQDLAAAYRLVAHYGWDDMVLPICLRGFPAHRIIFYLILMVISSAKSRRQTWLKSIYKAT